MINVELKAKHFYLIANTLLAEQAQYSFDILEKIKTACANQLDDTLVIVQTDPTMLVDVYKKMSALQEGMYSVPNNEMVDLLNPQIQAGVANNDSEWTDVGIQITAIRQANVDNINNLILYAKNKLGN
jgi:hypothetical protein